MSITPVPISSRLVFAPMAASRGNGEESWDAKWCTRKYAPSAPTSSAATARSIDWTSASEAERTWECGDGDQWPNERNPIFFMASETTSDGQTSRNARSGDAARTPMARETRGLLCLSRTGCPPTETKLAPTTEHQDHSLISAGLALLSRGPVPLS